ncbi:MAG: methyltransferase [Stappiaceae bacterium]
MTNSTSEAPLAEAYNRALAHEKAGELDAAAAAYHEVLALDPDDCGGAAVRLAAMGRGDVPDKAPDAYVATLFDQHAEAFDDILVDQLGYDIPEKISARLRAIAPGPYERMLDLGCGTGLSGEQLQDICGHITGVDLAENMVEIAYDKGDYDDLYVAEIVNFLQNPEEDPWDLILATDVLPYLGGLEDFFAGVANNLTSGGVFGFSSETLPPETFDGRSIMVGAKQRFAHAESYVLDVLAQNGFSCLEINPTTIRAEEGEPVPGHLVLARKD